MAEYAAESSHFKQLLISDESGAGVTADQARAVAADAHCGSEIPAGKFPHVCRQRYSCIGTEHAREELGYKKFSLDNSWTPEHDFEIIHGILATRTNCHYLLTSDC